MYTYKYNYILFFANCQVFSNKWRYLTIITNNYEDIRDSKNAIFFFFIKREVPRKTKEPP